LAQVKKKLYVVGSKLLFLLYGLNYQVVSRK